MPWAMIAVSFSSGFPRALCGKLWSVSLVWATPQGGQARAQVRSLCPVSYCTGGPAFSSLCPIPSQREREPWGRRRHCQEAGAEPGAAPSVTAGGAGQCGLLDPSPLPSRGESNNLDIIISATRVLPLREEMLSFNRFLNKIDGFPLYFWKSAAFLKKID